MMGILVNKKLIMLLVIIFLITGCGNTKTLNCELNSYGFSQDVSVSYNDDNIKSISMTMTYDKQILVNMESIDEFIKSEFKPMCDTYNSYEGVTCKINNLDKNIELIIDISDYSKLDQETKNSLGFNYQSYENLKNSLEESGYAC